MNFATNRTAVHQTSPERKSTTETVRRVVSERRQATLKRLSREVQQLEAAENLPGHSTTISAGCQAMDASLPSGGYVPGSVIEYLRATSGCGASYLALTAAAAALAASPDKYLVMVDTRHQFYPPALTSHCIDLQRVIWVRPQSPCDAVWATDQALRTTAVAAVIADLETLDERDARRLQLAAQRGGNLGLLLRGLSARCMPSWAEVQWVVRSLPLSITTKPALRRLEVILARLRGGRAGARMWLDVDFRQGQLHQVLPESSLRVREKNQERPIQHQERVVGQRTTPQDTLHLASKLACATRASG